MQLCDLVHKLAHYCHAIHNQSTGIVQCLHVAHFFKNERASEREFKFRFVATVRRNTDRDANEHGDSSLSPTVCTKKSGKESACLSITCLSFPTTQFLG